MSKADLDALFDAAMRNPKAGLNRAGRMVGKHRHTKLTAHQNQKRQGRRESATTYEARRQSWVR